MDVDRLIAEVFNRVPLWNQAHPDHHNRHVLKHLWSEVANELGSKRDAVQKKWKYLRDYFRTECAKKSKQNSWDPSAGGDELFTSSWPYFKTMKFLLDQMPNRPSSGNPSQSPSHVIPVANCTAVIREMETNNEEDSPQDEESFVETIRSDDDGVVSEDTVMEEPRYVLPNRKRKCQSQMIESALINLEKQKLQYLRSRTTNNPTCSIPDEDRSFFESLIPHVKMIKPEKKLLFRNDILQVVQRYAYCAPRANAEPRILDSPTMASPNQVFPEKGKSNRNEPVEDEERPLLYLHLT